MYITRIQLKNVRGFKEVELDLDRGDGTYAGWTVFAGQNGSGKSTLLQAIATAMYSNETTNNLMEIWSWMPDFRIELSYSLSDKEMKTLDLPFKQSGTIAYVQNHRSFKGPKHVAKAFGSYWSKLFLIGYGPFRRLHRESLAEYKVGKERPVQTLFNPNATLADAVSWLHKLHYQSLDNPKGPAEQLKEHIFTLLNDGLLPQGVKIQRISSEGLHVLDNGKELLLQQMSDGYRSIVSLVVDILQNMHNCFDGGLQLEEGREHYIVPHSGVILIDEMDAHLHVSWQKEIGYWFKSRFPNIQFLVTTHSPFICQAADKRGLISLKREDSGQQAQHLDEATYYAVVNGSTDDAVMTQLFGLEYTHSHAAEALRERLAKIEGKMIDNTVTSKELFERDKLLKQMPQTASAETSRALRQLREAR